MNIDFYMNCFKAFKSKLSMLYIDTQIGNCRNKNGLGDISIGFLISLNTKENKQTNKQKPLQTSNLNCTPVPAQEIFGRNNDVENCTISTVMINGNHQS